MTQLTFCRFQRKVERPGAAGMRLRLKCEFPTLRLMHVYEVRPRKVNAASIWSPDVLPFGRLWYGEPNAVANAIGYAEHSSRSHHAVIRIYNESGNVTETHEHKGEFTEW